ncbi:hypothetical protein MRX96_039958 [Rhipicephalus microplus]
MPLSPRILRERLPDDFANIIAELVDSASKKVYGELDGRAFFKEVTLLVPSSFNASAIVESNSTSDDLHIAAYERCCLFPLSSISTVKRWPQNGYVSGTAYSLNNLCPTIHCTRPNAAATKQGVLCESRSARDVIEQSDDFSGINLSGSSPYERVKLNIVQEAPLRLVVVWNVESQDLSSRTPHMTTLTALKKFAQTLVPEGSDDGVGGLQFERVLCRQRAHCYEYQGTERTVREELSGISSCHVDS